MKSASLALLSLAVLPLALGAHVRSRPRDAAPTVPGNYIVACLIPGPDGIPHLMKGMVRPLTVVKTGRPAPAPEGDVIMTLRDYNFFFSRPLAAGTHVIEVRNEGTQWHEFELVQLAPAPGAADRGREPADAGGVSWFRADLQPGRYALICFLPDRKDGKPHLEHGMLQEIEVGAGVAPVAW